MVGRWISNKVKNDFLATMTNFQVTMDSCEQSLQILSSKVDAIITILEEKYAEESEIYTTMDNFRFALIDLSEAIEAVINFSEIDIELALGN